MKTNLLPLTSTRQSCRVGLGIEFKFYLSSPVATLAGQLWASYLTSLGPYFFIHVRRTNNAYFPERNGDNKCFASKPFAQQQYTVGTP
jgi:hypothetical protein